MHVGFALLTLVPGGVGGSESMVHGLLEEFAAGRGPEQVSVLADTRVASAYGSLATGPVTMRRLRYHSGSNHLTRLGAMVSATIAPRRITRSLPDDLDVIHYPVTVPIPKTQLASVLTLHDVLHHERPEFFSHAERLFRRLAYDRAAYEAEIVVTVSEYARRGISKHLRLDEQSIEVVYHGIDHNRFTPKDDGDDRALVGLALPERFVIYPANLWPHKNHERLLKALARTSEVSVVMTGHLLGRDGWVRQLVEKLGLVDRVHHLGHVPSATLPALYRKANGMVFPSLYEGFGFPPLEAMACGCPVASSDAGALAEVCGDAALLFDPEDIEEIAAALDRITSDEELRRRLRKAGVSRAGRFTWSGAASRYVDIYRRAAAIKGS
jgi:glycosyltransferase involved in cell wall biosynthesis